MMMLLDSWVESDPEDLIKSGTVVEIKDATRSEVWTLPNGGEEARRRRGEEETLINKRRKKEGWMARLGGQCGS